MFYRTVTNTDLVPDVATNVLININSYLSFCTVCQYLCGIYLTFYKHPSWFCIVFHPHFHSFMFSQYLLHNHQRFQFQDHKACVSAESSIVVVSHNMRVDSTATNAPHSWTVSPSIIAPHLKKSIFQRYGDGLYQCLRVGRSAGAAASGTTTGTCFTPACATYLWFKSNTHHLHKQLHRRRNIQTVAVSMRSRGQLLLDSPFCSGSEGI